MGSRRVNWSVVALPVLITASVLYLKWDSQLPRYYHEFPATISVSDLELPIMPVKAPEPVEVRFTSYYTGDYSNSSTVTGSGLSVEDFEVNDCGWYTYRGKVVLAAATYACLESSTGACGKYEELPEGFQIHRFFDELTIYIDGNYYPAIVLDSCGASFWDEPLQRYDIFVANAEAVTDQIGYVEREKE